MPLAESVTLCLMVKAPEYGQAKTRLAPALGMAGAAGLARAMLRDSLVPWRGIEHKVTLALTGELDEALKQELCEWPQLLQGEGGLGAKLERVLQAGLSESDVAVVVGTDIPGIGVAELRETMTLLETNDAVLGPADDGGFYWLALRRCPAGLLKDIPWSSTDTCRRTEEKLVAAGMRVAMLSARFDVDTPGDLSHLAHYLHATPEAMPYTRRFLASEANRAISIIIPTLNEEARLGQLLRSLRKDAPWAEVIVVDGGSADATLAIARSAKGVVVLQTTPGRGHQLNCGAAAAMGGTLFFLHADATLPSGSLARIRQLMDAGAHVAGAFRLRTHYDCSGRKRPWVRPFLRLADLRSRYSKSPYGDQGLFVRACEFRAVGGYPEQPLFEDLHLSQRLARRGRMAILPGPLLVSGRRFQERPIYYLALMNSFPLLYRLGVSPGRLASLYPNHR